MSEAAPLQRKRRAIPVQRKMAIGPARDRYEAEADRAAAHVTGGMGGAPTITPLGAALPQRQSEEEQLEEEVLQTRRMPFGAVQRQPKEGEDELVQTSTLPAPAPRFQREPLPFGAVQRQPEEEEEELLQTESLPGTASRQQQPEEEEELQRESVAAGPSSVPSGVETGIQAARGGGRPLDAETRSSMEAGFGRDFSSVRVHDDARAARLNRTINARAFTTGPDIFFSHAAYNPAALDGQCLLAHELAHVAQQTRPVAVQTSRVQRDGNQPETTTEETNEETPKPRLFHPRGNSSRGINLDGPHGLLYMLPELVVPTISGKAKGVSSVGSISTELLPARSFHWTGKGSRSVTDEEGNEDTSSQVQIWERYIRNSNTIAERVEERFGNSSNQYRRGPGGPRVFYLQHASAATRSFTLIGTKEEIARNPVVLRPPYSPTGSETQFMQVDHYVEIQLGGQHTIENMWLLDANANQKSGRDIKQGVVDDVNSLVSDAEDAGFWGGTNPPKPGPLRSWPEAGHVEFARIRGESLRGASWDKNDIAAGRQIERLRELTPRQMAAAGLGLEPGDQPAALTIFLSRDSAFRRVMQVAETGLTYHGEASTDDFITGFHLVRAEFHQREAEEMQEGAQIATLHGQGFRKRPVETPEGEMQPVGVPGLAVPVRLRTQHGYESYIDRGYINAQLTARAAQLRGMSPITFDQAGLTEQWELLARGTLTTDNPLFPGLTAGIVLQGDAVVLDVTIPLERLQLGPFRPTEANLRAGYGENGVIFEGDAAFELDGVGSGCLEADRQRLSGSFDFDIDAFDPAAITVIYENGAWSGEAHLGICEGRIPFVESASVDVAVSNEGFCMDGTATLGGPGIPAGTTLEVAYNQETGELTFGADIPFDTARIPGITDARARLAVTRGEEGEWSVAGRGSGGISLPYTTGRLEVAYENGFLDAGGTAQINRPPMTGSAELHLSNRPVDAAGQPVDGNPLNSFRIWGSGMASITFGDFITGTVDIAFLENGEVELAGTIALPPEIPLIEERRWNYDILDFPRVNIPIIGLTVPVIRRNFGVFAYIGGGIDALVTVGPGVLRDTAVTVTFNPSEPENAEITGGATFDMSAGAAVRLTVTGGIGAGLGIVEATGDVGLRGGLGLDLSTGASVEISWTPSQGLELDASIYGEAQPKFTLDLVAGARIEVDIAVYSGTIWSHEWEHRLAEIGPDMTWRAELPATWSERDGLDLDINNLEITQPDIDLLEMASDIFEQVA
jgi:hypothetical protein